MTAGADEVDARWVVRTGGRGRLAAIAWGAGLGMLVGAALIGQSMTDEPPSTPDAGAVAAVDAVASATDRTTPALTITEPGLAGTFRTGPMRVAERFRVAGWLEDRVPGIVRLSVLDERGRVLDAARVATDNRFDAVLHVPNPPSAGTIRLEVAAYAPDGKVVAATTRWLRVVPRGADDPAADGQASRLASRLASRPIGEDGIMGGRPFERLPGG